MKTSLIIPCYNESKNLPFIFEKLDSLLTDNSFEIIFVENGSYDNSLSILENYKLKFPNIKFIALKQNQGYGHGIVKGLELAEGDLLAWTHADMQTNPLDILEGIRLFKSSQDKFLVKGLRYGRKLSDRFFTLCMSFYASINLGYFFWDINAQPTIFPSSFFKEWNEAPKDFSLDLYAYFLAKKNGYKIKRFDVFFNKRLFGISKWNFNFKSKVKFIIRNIKYINELKKKYR